MIVSEQEYKEMWKEVEGVTFTPLAKLVILEVDGKQTFTYEIIKTTDEVYQEYLYQPKPQPTKEELLEKKLLETQATLANLQEQILLKQNRGV